MRVILSSTLLVLAAAAAIMVSAHAEVRSVDAFNAVEARGRFKVEVATGPQSVEITGDDAQRLAARVHGDELVISVIDRPLFGAEPEIDAVVHVTAPAITSLQASRGAEVQADGMRAEDFNADASMGGILKVAGNCHRLETAASMGGQVDAGALNCAQVHASASMGGAIRATARNTVDASASMGGAVAISGAPAQRETHASMGGDISFD
ncbi:MAG: DUF2807 domain-containing protein [Pseudomonadota bacterium]